MKKKLILPLLSGALLLAAWGVASHLQKPKPSYTEGYQDENLLGRMVAELLDAHHYSPRTINDDISAMAFDFYLESLDYNKQYFLQSDIDALSKYKYSIDNELKDGKLEFYFKAVALFYQRLDEAEAISKELFDSPFTFESEGYFETDATKRKYFATEAERKEYWVSFAKYVVMNRLANKMEKAERDQAKGNAAADSVEIEDWATMEKKSREQESENLANRFKRRREIDAEDQFSFFINSLNAAFGPHTEYFPPQERENFEMRMTGRLEGIGAQLTKDNEYIKVVYIVPGSASWRQGELKENDLIIKVAQQGEEAVDIVDAPMKDAIKMIRGPKGTEVTLTIQKPSGETKEITIVRDVVVQDETYAKSALIDNSNTKHKLGYIYLPSFYSTFGGMDGRSSAIDVKTEVERLMAVGAKGIILDLRNNGGGSLQEAVDMAGLFFDKGPVVQVKDEGRPPRVYGDRDPSVTYAGPIVVMVNNFSASASEILAAALKDYGRAIVVGNRTFGKGTVQTMMDLNEYLKKEDNPSGPLGSLKITIQQFYRVNGASTQLHGVHPHIYFPNEYGFMEGSIAQEKNPLPWDSLAPANYMPSNLGTYNLDKIMKNSAKRMEKSHIFTEVNRRNDALRLQREKTLVMLNLDEEMKQREQANALQKEFKELFTPDGHLHFTSLQVFKEEEDEAVKKEKKEAWEKALQKDFYLYEAIDILEDAI
ncbi:MAG: carboxy terminal-processing peptidase [Bacteroidetes bacterium]|nr:carboxy terminal-processing peptidase [Bacteroidota bacterium]